ncbi:MAG: Transcriptional regulatory protein ZraR [Deltaproteobacteria bacterium ADurb.Bin151]|jgi:DNA-binding NtrC family response regulator|nr:MAG: Transcriptional regulatory protein ZraR [Deltaproteobacteria bacterium ADurb.Bin151]HNZ11485.1 sigma-54 dependent transcriptional regulator [Smithellaceae bacterium]HOG81152.1 sigma-54 dependent transcriptional regulator [Smithellaceae bacterium]HOQ43060.1 sigma-54 dependent transcriptional regulator [Smithellaceae bacterium]HPL66580.1 sigma-54 dependent transcriptional regulator [Smithellaceae bacterium]
MNRILIVDDELNMRLVLSAMLKKEGYEVAAASNGSEALQILKSGPVAAVITDLKMPQIDGMELLDRVSQKYPNIPVIMITAHGTVATAVEALKKGALDYITKPFELEELKNVVSKAIKTRDLKENELLLPPEEIERGGIIGSSQSTMDIFDAIKRVAPTTTTVLINGETGTGKELVAEAIHRNSPRKNNPLIKINCAAIAETLMESELFGYEKGAFTGAVLTKPGKFELANKGTLFLDEVSEIPRDMQVKLLRVLQEQEFERVGGIKTIKVDVRIIAATNQDLLQSIRKGDFREDLYYRINVFPVNVPPLRNRMNDLLPLVDYFIDKLNRKLELDIRGMDDAVTELLMRHKWPGNIRELENLMERMMLVAKTNVITVREVPSEFLTNLQDNVIAPFSEDNASFKDFMRTHMENVEKQMIIKCLEESGDNVTRAAKQLGISRKGLQLKMIKYNLRK